MYIYIYETKILILRIPYTFNLHGYKRQFNIFPQSILKRYLVASLTG